MLDSSEADPYKVLGVPVDADIPVIRFAHRKLVLKCHPDKFQDAALKAIKQDEFFRVQVAYEILSDDKRRKEYDESVMIAELRRRAEQEQRGLATRSVHSTETFYFSAPPTRRAASYEESRYESRRTPSTEDERAADRRAREEEIRARELKARKQREKERVTRTKKDRDKDERQRRKYRGPYVEEDDSDDTPQRSNAKEQSRSEKSYNIPRAKSPSLPRPSYARTATYADSPYGVHQKYVEILDPEDDDDSDSYVPLSTKEKEIEGEIKHRKEWMQSVFALKPASVPPVESQDSEDVVEASKNVETEKKPAKVMLTSVPPTQLGIKVMNPETTDPSIDIIAVHGLGAIPEFTWKAHGTGVNWLSDSRMLPLAVPEARIMRFGYDSLWLGKTPVRTRLGIIADKLLLHLGKERNDISNPRRPLIFIGHCFGGLVIQRALITAKLEENTYRNIFQSSVGVVFLGTPHRGSKSFLAGGELRTRIEMRNDLKRGESDLPQGKLLAQILSKSDLRQGIEPGVLDEMRSDNGTLLTDSEFFSRLCRSNELLITSFFEQRGSDLLKTIGDSGPEEFIVPEESATFDSHTNIGLPLDHFSLNKFSDPQDGNFKEVCWEITKMYQAAKENLLSGRPVASKLKNDAVSKLMRKNAPSVSLRRSFKDLQEEENLRQFAMQEISQEEADKLAAAKEEEFEKKYQERLAAEKEQESALAENETEKRCKDRWLANMMKYRVQDAQKILDGDQLPKNSDLTPQEIKDKLRWYKNRIRASLREREVPGGIVDEIVNDMAGDTMEVNGERTTFTKMALIWVDLKTLKRYDVPYILDKDDPSTVIITRWVPEYEQEFFWDHSYKLRQKAKERKERPPKKKHTTKSPWEPSKKHAQAMNYAEYYTRKASPRYNEAPYSPYPRTRYEETPYSTGLRSDTHDFKPTYIPYAHKYDGEPSPGRGRRNSGTRSRHASTESIRSAPDSEAVARRRQQSRTMSEERPAAVQRQSYDGGRSEGKYASDGETGRKSSGLMSGIKKKVFGQRSSDDDGTYPKRTATYAY